MAPRQFDRRTVVQNDNGVWLYLQDFRNQAILTGRQLHVAAVIAFRFKAVRESCKNDCFVSIFCCFYCCGGKRFVISITVCREPFCISDLSMLRQGVKSAGRTEAVDMRTAAALEPRVLCKATDKCNFF